VAEIVGDEIPLDRQPRVIRATSARLTELMAQEHGGRPLMTRQIGIYELGHRQLLREIGLSPPR
jgi:hypothetical protein